MKLAAVFAAALLAGPAAGQPLGGRIGFYQWSGVAPGWPEADLLTAARQRAVALGSRVFRFYLGGRFDYRLPELDPRRFESDLEGPLTLARLLDIPRYRAVLTDPALETVVLTAYSIADYGGGPDEVSLLRPFGADERRLVQRQIGELADKLYGEFGQTRKTIILANHEADEKLIEILDHTGDLEMAVQNLSGWTRARFEALDTARGAHPNSLLELYLAFEVSAVHLNVAEARGRARKTSWSEGTNALRAVAPLVEVDLVSYSAYESTNSPYRTQSSEAPPGQVAERLARDLDVIRGRAAASISAVGRRAFGDRFVMLGELGFDRHRFEPAASGGLLPRLFHAIDAALDWGCPYIVIWQLFDAPQFGARSPRYGMYDSSGQPAPLRPAAGCASVAGCLESALREDDLKAWQPPPEP